MKMAELPSLKVYSLIVKVSNNKLEWYNAFELKKCKT